MMYFVVLCYSDLKIENMMLTGREADATVTIIDFGLMVKLREGETVFHDTDNYGTPGYIR
jgi:hypothetical protein